MLIRFNNATISKVREFTHVVEFWRSKFLVSTRKVIKRDTTLIVEQTGVKSCPLMIQA